MCLSLAKARAIRVVIVEWRKTGGRKTEPWVVEIEARMLGKWGEVGMIFGRLLRIIS